MRRTPLLSLIRIATVIVLTLPASAQWNTPAINGSIGTGEYGTNNSLQNAGNTGQKWYMTWDATNLYLAVVNANLAEGAVVYLGTGGSGSTTGNAYDGTNFSSLPFPAQFVTYFKDGYREYRTSNGGGWSGPTANYGAYVSNSGNQNPRELAIPWSALTSGGPPASFIFFGYLTSSGGYVYGESPSDNPGAFIGTRAICTQYYAVTNTGNGSQARRRSRSSNREASQPPTKPASTTILSTPSIAIKKERCRKAPR